MSWYLIIVIYLHTSKSFRVTNIFFGKQYSFVLLFLIQIILTNIASSNPIANQLFLYIY